MQSHPPLPHWVLLRCFNCVALNPKPCNCFMSAGLPTLRPHSQVRNVRGLGSAVQIIRQRVKNFPTNAASCEVTLTPWTSSGNTGCRMMRAFAITSESLLAGSVPGSITAKLDGLALVHCRTLQKYAFGIPRPSQGCTAVSLTRRRGYGRKYSFRVAGKKAGDGLLEKEGEVLFKRIVSEGDSVTMFYGSDTSSSSEDDEEEEQVDDNEKEMTAEATAEDTHCEKDEGREHNTMSNEGEEIRVKAELKPEGMTDKQDVRKLKKNEKGNRKEKKLKATTNEKDYAVSDSDDEGKRIEDHDTEHTGGMVEGSDSESDDEEGLAINSEMDVKNDGLTDLSSETPEEDNEELEVLAEDELKDLYEDDDLWDEEDEGDVVAGDGGDGGGVVLGGTQWGKNALDLAEQVLTQSGGDLSLFAFKVSPDGVIRVRLDKLSDRYGSPTVVDIETFLKNFMSLLEVSGEVGTVPKDVRVEVSSPGAERVVRVPEDLERFKDLPMYVLYSDCDTETENGTVEEKDGVLQLDSLDTETGVSVWKLANVKLNREIMGKGRPLNSKQKSGERKSLSS